MRRTARVRWTSLAFATLAATAVGVGPAREIAYRVTLETPPGARRRLLSLSARRPGGSQVRVGFVARHAGHRHAAYPVRARHAMSGFTCAPPHNL